MPSLKDLMGYGRDFAQGASNSIASNVSAPVDGLAWLLRKAGLPMPPNPMGGSDWMKEQGLTQEPDNRLAGLMGEFAGMTGPMVAAAKAPQLAAGLNQVAQNAMIPSNIVASRGAFPLNPHAMNSQTGVIGFPGGLTRDEITNHIRQYAEQFSKELKERGLSASVNHSGSIAGPSSYVNVTNPITGAGTFDNLPFRFSDHGKGPVQAQYVREIQGNHSTGLKLEEWDNALSNLAKTTPEQKAAYDISVAKFLAEKELFNSPLVSSARIARPSVFKSMQEARESNAEFSKAFSNSGKYIGGPK